MALAGLAWAGGTFFQRAAVVSMQTADCTNPHHSVMAALSGTPDTHRELCAEYILGARLSNHVKAADPA
jgi:hypothetical protein